MEDYLWKERDGKHTVTSCLVFVVTFQAKRHQSVTLKLNKDCNNVSCAIKEYKVCEYEFTLSSVMKESVGNETGWPVTWWWFAEVTPAARSLHRVLFPAPLGAFYSHMDRISHPVAEWRPFFIQKHRNKVYADEMNWEQAERLFSETVKVWINNSWETISTNSPKLQNIQFTTI